MNVWFVGFGHAALITVASPLQSSAQAPAPIRVVQGVVRDSATLEPLRGATVSAGSAAVRTVTDSEGRYRIVGVDRGPLTVWARQAGWASVMAEVAAGGDTTVDLALGPPTERMPVFSSGRTLRGVIRDCLTKQPIAGARIVVERQSVVIIADAAGAFTIQDVRRDSIAITASGIGHQGRRVDVAPGGDIMLSVGLMPSDGWNSRPPLPRSQCDAPLRTQ